MVVQESEVGAQTSHSSEDQRASVRPVALFSSKRNEQRNQTWRSVFGNANLSNFSGTLLEGNKDHLLNQAKSDLARKESHVESLNKCVDDLQKRTEVQDRALQDVQNEFVESRREQARLQEELVRKENALRDTQIRSMHELEKMRRAQIQQVDEFSIQKLRENHDTIYSTAHFPLAAIARTDEFCERFWRIPGYWITSLWKIVSRFQSAWDDSDFTCFAQPRQKIAEWYMESIRSTGKRFWKSISYVWFTSRFPQRISFENVQRKREAVPLNLQPKMLASLTSEDGQNYGTIPMHTFASRPLTTNSTIPVELPQNDVVGQERQQISELQFDKFPTPSSFLV